jgi:hypothetical protein
MPLEETGGRRMAQTGPVRRIGIFLAWGLAVLLPHPPAQGAGHRLVTRVTEPVEINGELYPAGELSIREVGALSPTVTLNEVHAGGECLGLLPARTGHGGPPSSGDAVVFEPSDRGHLVLVGFTYRGQSAREFACPRTAPGGIPERETAAATPPETSPSVAVK